MDLVIGECADESLVICPTTHANLARFLNGSLQNKNSNVIHNKKIKISKLR